MLENCIVQSRNELSKTILIDSILGLNQNENQNTVNQQLDDDYKKYPHVNRKAIKDNKTPLMVAAELWHLPALHWLLNPRFFSMRRKADVHLQNSKLETALSYAVSFKSFRGANQELTNEQKALLSRQNQCVDLILKHGAKKTGGASIQAATHGNLRYLKIAFNSFSPTTKHTAESFHRGFNERVIDMVLKQALLNEHIEIVKYIASIFYHINRVYLGDGANLSCNIYFPETTAALILLFQRNFDLAAACYKFICDSQIGMRLISKHLIPIIDDTALVKRIILKYRLPLTWKFIEAVINQPNNDALVDFVIKYKQVKHDQMFNPADNENNDPLRVPNGNDYNNYFKLIRNYKLLNFYLQQFSYNFEKKRFSQGSELELICEAIKLGDERVVLLLLEKMTPLNTIADQGYHAIHTAAKADNHMLMLKLLWSGVLYAPPNPTARKNLSPQMASFLDAYETIFKNQPHLLLQKLSYCSSQQRKDLHSLFAGDKVRSDKIKYAISQLESVAKPRQNSLAEVGVSSNSNSIFRSARTITQDTTSSVAMTSVRPSP